MRLGRAAREHDLLASRGVDEAPDLVARAFERGGRALAELVDAAVHVGVIQPLLERLGIERGARLLRRGRVVEIRERLAVHELLERREIRAQPRDVGDQRGST